MGGQGDWVQSSGFSPNGLLPNESASVSQLLDPERWSKAEERTAELIAHIQPNQPSEEHRQAIASYVQRLITKCFSCQVFTFGSVPLKTYLPDGDIDLTAFSKKDDFKDNWANEVEDMLKREEKSENAEFRVKEVQCIQAEVKIIKCLVENIVVDISFNQIGGLCTLCFLEEVSQSISQIHLFKRSIILIKAWCYYESRILGAHHGLISTYALETLVLYIFHVYNNSFSGPLEVLYRFLEFFSKFDWENFCVSLWGPVPISSLPDMTGKPPLKDGGELLLSKVFLDACSSVYAVFPGGMENQEQPFVSKHFNVIDPLRTNNNLGRSVSKGNFFRIRSAFAFGAQRLARLLDCPKENIIAEVNQFFSNTWDRHGKWHRPDVYGSRGLNMSQVGGSDTLRNDSNIKAKENGASCDSEADLSYVCQLAMYQFARTHSSPELTDTCTEVLSQGRHSGASKNCSAKSSNCSIDDASDFSNTWNSYYSECGLSSKVKEHLSVADTIQMHQAEQDLVNMVASSTGYSFSGHVDVPGQKAKDSTGDLPFTFYPTGPPVPFLTMLPLYSVPTETGTATMSTNHSDRDKELNNFHKSKLDHNLDLAENLGHGIFNRSSAMNGAGKSHILNGDFTSHWQNLQYGRLCQNSQHHGSFLYSSSNGAPPVNSKEQFPRDGPGRPPSGNAAYSPPVTPISSLQPASIEPAGVYQLYADEIPRYRGGTGKYLSNPKISSRDRKSSHTRNHRGSNSYDGEGNGNMNTKSRFAGRGQGRTQSEKPSARVDRSTASNSRFSKPFRPDQIPSHQSRSNSTNGGSGSSGYGMYGLPLVNPAVISPSIFMLYPYDQNVSYISPADLLDFGSLQPLQFSGLGEGSSSLVNEGLLILL